MSTLKKSRKLNEKEIIEVLALVPSDIDEPLFVEYFANRKSREARFNAYDMLTIPAGKVFNKVELDSTIGRYLFNLFILDYDLLKLIGYQNYEMGVGKMTDKVDKLLLEDVISGERYVEFLNRLDFMYGIARFLTPSLTLNILKPTPKAKALKEELLAKNKEDIDNNNYAAMGKIEKQVLDQAIEEIKDMPDFEIYKSGAGGGMGKAFNNAFKNMTYFRGAIRNLADNDAYYVSTHSLLDGIPPEEMDKYADITVQASYGRAVGTRQGGYEYKKIASSLQGVTIGKKDSDCGTKLYKEMEVTGDTKNMLLYRYIIEGGKLLLITPDNVDKYINKIVKLRTPLYCQDDIYCNKCCGELYYMLNLENVGLTANRVGTSLLNESLKAFHDLSLKILEFDVFEYIE